MPAKIRAGEWVLVCDGGKALILENAGDDKFPNLQTHERFCAPHPATHELGADAPGRVHSSVGTVRSSVEQTDWHDRAEHDFIKSVAAQVNKAVQAGQAKSLIVVAPPRALGVLRDVLSPQARGIVHKELDRDYTNLSVGQIERRLVQAVAR